MKVIKIGAMWCPGCIVMHKVWDKINKEYPNIEVKSLDLDMDEEEVKKYNIGDILPVTIFYKDDTELERLIGEKKFEDIESVIKKYE
ncbi:MAG: thioredoxin family protein [Bacilli bacterium]|nr:thioredoxin family protein [Bacilli bacterium]